MPIKSEIKHKQKKAFNPGNTASPVNSQTVRYPSFRFHFWFLIVFTSLLYVQTIWYNYTLDDTLMITQNKFTKMGVAGFDEIMTNDAFTGFFGIQKKLVAGGRYRPLSQIMFAFEYQFFGLNPAIGHMVNVILYALTCGLLFLFLQKLFKPLEGNKWYTIIPFIASLLFAAHPLHTEVVANIKGRDEILTWLLSLACLFLILEYFDKKKKLHLLIVLPVFLFAILAKENAVTLLAVIPLMLYFFRKPKVSEYLISLSPVFLAIIIYLGLRQNALGYLTSTQKVTELLNDPYVNSTLSEKIATNTYTWGIYLKLLLFPHPLTHDYYPKQIPLISWADFRAIISLLLYFGLGLLAVMKFRKKHIISFAILFFFITFSISSNLVFNIGTFMNERFMFVPLLGFAIALAYLATKHLNPKVLRILLIIVVALYSIKTISRNTAWKDDYTLFTTDALTSVNSAKVNVSAGGKSLEKAQAINDPAGKERLLKQAESYLQRALEIYPSNSAGWVLLGNVYLEKKNYKVASDYYLNCLKLYPTQAEALTKLIFSAVQLSLLNQFEPALNIFKELWRLEPGNDEHLIHIADQYSKINKQDTALIMMKDLISKRPDYGAAYSKLGEIYGRAFNDIDNSEKFLLKAYQLDPKNSSTLENLGIVYGFRQNFRLSVDFFKKALAIDSVNTRMLQNLSSTYRLMGNHKAADSLLRKVSELQQNNQD